MSEKPIHAGHVSWSPDYKSKQPPSLTNVGEFKITKAPAPAPEADSTSVQTSETDGSDTEADNETPRTSEFWSDVCQEEMESNPLLREALEMSFEIERKLAQAIKERDEAKKDASHWCDMAAQADICGKRRKQQLATLREALEAIHLGNVNFTQMRDIAETALASTNQNRGSDAARSD